eukprot:GHVU01219597.1.p2 GENE.GHVU01219597.1~~GHVU01219597.1.p2  ORF type:complete len:222 (+),score=18.70 GHVU01219597.1:396-1061(+)
MSRSSDLGIELIVFLALSEMSSFLILLSAFLCTSLHRSDAAFPFSGPANLWCKAFPSRGMPDWAKCQAGTGTKYQIFITPAIGKGIDLDSNVDVTIVGSSGEETKPIKIATTDNGTRKQVLAEREDVGSPTLLKARISSPTSWSCKQIEIHQGPKFWTFDCSGVLSPHEPVKLAPPVVSKSQSSAKRGGQGRNHCSLVLPALLAKQRDFAERMLGKSMKSF